MATYKVKTAQNIFDVAIMLYGSIEGLFDLLISNDWLSMKTELKPGMELEYHDYYKTNEGIVSVIEKRGYLAANSERRIYHKSTDQPIVFVFAIADNEADSISFAVSGTGTMLVDWGDNSSLEEVMLTSGLATLDHWFDNKVEKRRVKVYGDFQLSMFDAEGIPGTIYTMRPVEVSEFRCHKNKYPLDGLLLFENVTTITYIED